MDKVRVGVVGVGGMGLNHVKALKEIVQAELVAVADINAETAAKVGKEYDATPYDDHKKMIAEAGVDAVCVATPHPLHPVVANDAMDAGKHVFTEKPIASTVRQADSMIECAKSNGVILAVMYQQRTSAVNQEVKRMISDGEIGEIYRASLIAAGVRTQAYYDSGEWRGTWKLEGGGVLLNQSPHDIDRFQWFVGMPKRVTGLIKTAMHKIEVEDFATAILEYPNGAVATVQVNTIDIPSVSRYEICGTKARVLIEGGKARLAVPEQPLDQFISTCEEAWGSMKSEWKDIEVPKKPSGHVEMIRDFVMAVIENRPPLVDGEEGRNSLEIANAVILSSVRGKTVELPLDRAEYDAVLEELIARKAVNP